MKTTTQLMKKARIEIERGDAALIKGERHYLRAGQHLLKAREAAKHGEWESALEKIGISSQRASELMRVASGEVTVVGLRVATRERWPRAERPNPCYVAGI
jgi:hypothetical protein